MLTITIPEVEIYDSEKGMFSIEHPEVTIDLEHSLLTVSQWESKWCTPYMSTTKKTEEQTYDYIKCMIQSEVDDSIIDRLTTSNVDDIARYIQHPHTATTIKNDSPGGREVVTSELIYYWLVKFNIPFECERWHLNRLMTLINVCVIKESPRKKMSKRDLADRNSKLNESRKKALNSKG